MKTLYTYLGGIIMLDTRPMFTAGAYRAFDNELGGLSSTDMSVPHVIAQAVFFMQRHNIRSLIVDGQEIKRAN